MTPSLAPGLDQLITTALDALASGRKARGGPLPTGSPAEVEAAVDDALGHDPLPLVGVGDESALADLVTVIAAGSADPSDPACAGHLHCPPLPVAVAADAAASALNQSMDSWDQAPGATALEQRVVRALGELAGWPEAAGAMTTGGTASTYTALFLARDAAPGPVRVYAGEDAHFSVDRGAHLLGVGDVVKVGVDADRRMDVAALSRALAAAPAGERPVVVATAGTTDFGSIDPLRAVSAVVDDHGGWLHVDAAYGGGLLFSEAYRGLLDGLAEADTVALDLHKLGWQPAAAGVLLARAAAMFDPLQRRAAYLNPADDEDAGYTSLLGRSLRTTRRADVLKVAVTLRALGMRGLGERVDACLALARHGADAVRARPELELAAEPVLSTVVFRFRGSDEVNARLRRRLLAEGRAVVGRTEVDGRIHLKLTLLHPEATPADVDALLDRVVEAGMTERDFETVAGGTSATGRRVDDYARHVLLRCWLREAGVPVTGPGRQTVPLTATDRSIRVEVLRRSPSGAHELGTVRDESGRVLELPELAQLLTAEAAARAGQPADHGADARDRIVESAARMARYAERRAAEESPPELPHWLLGEQDLLTGHPWHPMSKARDGLADADDTAFSPEARGRFPLHWFAAAPEVAAWDGAGHDVPTRLRALAGPLAAGLPDGYVPVPAHPWQAARLERRETTGELLDRGLLRPLGAGSDLWWATSSLRTVARPDAELMLKLSLGLRVTNSRRENTRAEGRLAVRTARLVQAGLGAALARAYPGFGVVLDRGWVGVAGGGLETVLRDVPFDPSDPVACAAALVDPRPDLERSRLAGLVSRVADARGTSLAAAGRLFFRRWVDAVSVPVLWLHGTWGIGLEAHLQNVLIGLDEHGLPDRAWYRDNQGWYAAASHLPALDRLVPDVGADVPLVFDDALVTDRIAYYVGVNHLLTVAAAVARAGGGGEEELLRDLRSILERHVAGPRPSPVAELLLDAETLPAKANLLTGVDGRDEVHAPVEAQSVYVDLPNPLLEVAR